jgi:hypothetical protein
VQTLADSIHAEIGYSLKNFKRILDPFALIEQLQAQSEVAAAFLDSLWPPART